MEHPLYDCAVIGGGLGGLSLAIQLGRAGKQVILFEKDKYPFHKVCGEYISMESWSFLEELGVNPGQLELPMISRLNISACNGNTLSHRLGLGGFGISRYMLDQLLARLAQQQGVQILDGTKVDEVFYGEDGSFTIKALRQHFRARVACGAFGKRSNLDVKLQRNFIRKPQPPTRNYIGVKYHVEADLPADLIELHNFKDGYCGISRIEDNKYCLCYLTTAKNLQENGNNIKQMEQQVLMRNPHLDKYFTRFKSLYENPLVISQISFEPKSTAENHILMLGDAAGLITPLCGNGMSMAMHAARLLSPLIVRYLEDSRFSIEQLEAEYQQRWHKYFSVRLTSGRILQNMLGRESMTNAVIGTLKYFPAVVDRLIRLTHGKPF